MFKIDLGICSSSEESGLKSMALIKAGICDTEIFEIGSVFLFFPLDESLEYTNFWKLTGTSRSNPLI